MNLSLSEIQTILDEVQYKPGWEIDAYETLAQGPFLRIRASLEDSYNPGGYVDLSIESQIPSVLLSNKEDFLTWLRWRLEIIEVHECHEWLRWSDGRPVFDPHGEGATKPRD